MAIKNTNLGGTDWIDNEVLEAADLNDTFDAIYEKVVSNPAFWLNSEFYDVYDDFSSYTTGDNIASENPTNWTLTDNSDGSGASKVITFQTVASTTAGGTTDEARIRAGATGGAASELRAKAVAKAINLTANKHKFIRVNVSWNGSTNDPGARYRDVGMQVSFNKGANYDKGIFDSGDSVWKLDGALTEILVVAKGSNEYDCYIGGKLIRTVTDATFQIWIQAVASGNRGDTCNCYVYIDDVREGKFEVS